MVRYGPEVEGKHKGLMTLVVYSNVDHARIEIIRDKIGRDKPVEHLWLECQPRQVFNWDVISFLASAYKITLLLRDELDMPPGNLLPPDVCFVWKAPMAIYGFLQRVHYIQSAMAPGLGSEFERRAFVNADYEKDEVFLS